MANPNHVKSIFSAASEKPLAERAAFLDQATAGDAVLRARVEALLKAHDNPDSFLNEAAAEFGATIDLSPTEQPLAERPGTLIGPYKLLEQIGEGGMGVVYMAEQQKPVHRRVALKIIKAGMDTRQVIARFEAERQALALMDHSNIARVLDAGATDSGRPYFVMELVRGIPVTEYCDQYNLSIPKRLELFSQVCQAVQHAHQKGLIHRDIKPSNVLVSTQDDHPVAKVIDFGVAKAMQGRLTDRTLFTEFQHLVGTPAYMSPEQAGGSLDIDTRSDVYSLGVLLYELLTGSPPFDPQELRSKAFAEMQRIIREVEPPTPSRRLSTLTDTLPSVAAQRAVEPRKLAAVVRGELDWIVMKSLEKDRMRRYETPGSMARDIERYLRDEPVLACPPSVMYRLKKFARRNKIAAAFVVLLVAAVAALTISNIQTRRNEQRAIIEAAKAQAVSDLLQRMLASANPDQLKDTQYTVRQLLDDFSKNFGAELSDQPEVEAEIRTAIGRAYRGLAKGHDAEGQVERALELRRELFGPDHVKVAESLVDCAQVHFIQSRFPEAVAAAREALRIYEVRGTTGLPVIRAYTILQRALINSAQFDEAQVVTDAALSIASDSEVEYPEIATILHALADMRLGQERFPEAEQAARSSVELHRRLHGPKHPETAWGLNALGHALKAQQKYPEAEAAFREALAIFRQRFRGQHHSFDIVLPSLKQVLEARGDKQGLEALAQRQEKDFAVSETAMFNTWLTRSQLRKEAGRFKEATEALQEARKWMDRNDVAQRESMAAALSIVASHLQDHPVPQLGPNLFEPLFRQALALRTELANEFPKEPKHFEEMAHFYRRIGWVVRNKGNSDEARQCFEMAVELFGKLTTDDIPQRDGLYSSFEADSLLELSQVVAANDANEAAALARRCVDVCRTLSSKYPENLQYRQKQIAALGLLANHLGKAGRQEEVKEVHRELVALLENVDDANSYIRLGIILIQLGKTDEGLAAIDKGIALNPTDANVLNQLAWFLSAAEEPQHRNPTRAVDLAKKAVEQAAQDGAIWNTFGVAKFRADKWQDAIKALEKAMELREGGDAFDWFFLAMAHWQLGHKEEARKWYDKAVEWMDKNQPKNEELLRFRAEAVELLGITDPKPAAEPASEQPTTQPAVIATPYGNSP
jgi:serine/threonine protein kinase/Tfp pilus assembly protein PilF